MSEEMATEQPVYVEQRGYAGRMITPLPGKHTITQADASFLAKKRWAKAAQAKAARLAREFAGVDPEAGQIMNEHGRYTADDAAAFAYVKQYTALLDSDKPRGDDFYRLEQMRGAVPLAGEVQAQAQAQAPGAITLTLPAATGALLVELLRELAGRQVVDAEARDVDPEQA